MSFENEDTIVAIATPAGTGAISIIRVSGNDSIEITNNIFRGKINLTDVSTHTIHYGNIITNNGEIIDDVLISVFRTPNSYTGENSIEINCHGGQLVTQKIIDRLLEQQTRLAYPGEFTKRAFLNNKIDLVQAESVIDIINSRSEASLRGARTQLDGFLSRKVETLRSSLLDISSLLELELDFSEEEIELVGRDEIIKKINEFIVEIDSLLKSYSFGKILKDGINIAIVGEPNVGKSSLLNYLLKESRAIVSDIPGTTRDIIHEDISIDGFLFKLYDTAGIRVTSDMIEREGVERTMKIIKDSDLILYVFDAAENNHYSFFDEILNLTNRDRIITILNKVDLDNINEMNTDSRISCITGEGLLTLLNLIKEKCVDNNLYSENSVILTNSRHYAALEKTKINLLDSLKSISYNMSEEFISIHLRNAENSLNEIVGLVTTEDILNNIFSKFCIGK